MAARRCYHCKQLVEAGEPSAVRRRIVGFHQDEQSHWVADLECGHSQHVRHDPPWQNRPWVQSAEGRQRFLGVELRCRKCIETAPAP